MTTSNPAKTPDIAIPIREYPFRRSTTKPRIDVAKAIGVVEKMAHVDHMQIPDLQSGCDHVITMRMVHGVRDITRPATPMRLLVVRRIDISPVHGFTPSAIFSIR